MATWYGMWPGVVAIAGDAEIKCVPCAAKQYGWQRLAAVINGNHAVLSGEGRKADA